MIYDVEVNGRRRRAEVARAEGGFLITLDGRPHLADVTLINGVYSLILGDGGVRRSFEVAIADDASAPGRVTVHVNGHVLPALVAPARGSWARRGQDADGGATGPHRVTAPMPGRIARVLVGRGDVVAARQAVIVVEAMKMENELRAPRAGTVVDVSVGAGASVEAGAVLVIIE